MYCPFKQYSSSVSFGFCDKTQCAAYVNLNGEYYCGQIVKVFASDILKDQKGDPYNAYLRAVAGGADSRP